MTPVAFFAPLKSPKHPTPSGDRELAQALIQALETAGFTPQLASDLRCLDIAGDPIVQQRIARQADTLVPKLIAQGQAAGWQAWITYHNYYKAPDLLGPRVAKHLRIPYVQIESSRARKRLSGPWANFAASAETASSAAHLCFYFTERDRAALQAYAHPGQVLFHLKPFLARETLPSASGRAGPILTVGMMRPGDKTESYRLIAQTLPLLSGDWHLVIAGDGPARAQVEDMMRPFGTRVHFLGKLDRDEMQAAYGRAACLFWPGVNEAIGLTYLEAQAVGLPVIAQDRPGLREVICPAIALSDPATGPAGLALALHATPPEAETLRLYIAENHLLPAAAATLSAGIRTLL